LLLLLLLLALLLLVVGVAGVLWTEALEYSASSERLVKAKSAIAKNLHQSPKKAILSR
jgi:hypothetical protein